MNECKRLIQAAAIADGRGGLVRPGAVLIEGNSVLGAGSPEAIGQPSDVSVLDQSDRMVIPALVNVHAHLDLTHIGPQPLKGSFVEWVNCIRAERCVDDAGIAESVRQGIELSRRGGTVIVGDIAGAGSVVPIDTLRRSPMAGVSFLEVFGIGRGASRAIAHINHVLSTIVRDADNVRLGVQPHAPYSCSPAVFEHVASLDVPIATHLAETREELEFVRHASGDLARMLQSIGVWDETIQPHGVHSVELIVEALSRRSSDHPVIAAHCNYIADAHFDLLARAGITVAYCPRASDYFGHPHRYRDMLDAGVPVALGTDSILCLDTPDRISTLDEMRHLYRRDGCDPVQLLRMATINGAEALGYEPHLFTLDPSPVMGLISVRIDPNDRTDPLAQALRHDEPISWVEPRFEMKIPQVNRSTSPWE